MLADLSSMKLPKYVSAFTDRHGGRRFRFRRGSVQFYFSGLPGSELFQSEYARCMEKAPPLTKGKASWVPISTQARDYLRRRGWQAKAPYVYFITDGHHAVKVGRSTNVVSRLGRFVTGSPRSFRLIAIIPGSEDVERQIHEALAAYKVRGEWFKFTPQVRLFVTELSNHFRGDAERLAKCPV